MDLHVHTPASADYQQPGVSILDILHRAEERGLDAIALTDHNSVRGYADLWREIEDLELLEYLGRQKPAEAERLTEFRRLLAKILVLPGFEFTAQFGFHILAIFPEGTTVRLMEHLLLLLGVPEDRFGSGEVGATTDVLRAYEILAQHGALVIGAHVNSTHGIAMQGLRFGGQTKIAYTQDPNLHALEVTDLLPVTNRRSTARFFSGVKSEYPRRMHCIQGSDAHRLEQDLTRESNLGVGDRPTEVLLPEMSFAALKALLASNEFDRTRAFTAPPSDPIKAARLEGNTAHQAFHESATSKRGQGAILRDVVAFANSSGGRIYIGASASEKRAIAGLQDATSLVAELTRDIAAQITPPVEVTFEEPVSDGKPVVVLTVAEGARKPHAIAPGGIFVRRDTESAQATRDEIVLMVTGAGSAVATAPEAPAPSPANGRAQVEAAPPSGAAPGPQSRTNGRGRAQTVARKESDRPVPPWSADDDAMPGVTPAEPVDGLLEVYEEAVGADPVAPTTGIEVLHAFEQDGTRYYTLRDLRYHKLIHNVTKSTDRRLWRAAIGQREKGDLDEAAVRWNGDFGLWRSYRQRSGDRRYDLVYRGDGDPRVFYGVSEAGMDGRWKALLPAKATA
ncbi:MAG: putative DNA binding domain-containing protein [Chloroflexi bacterium]|nr:putative DNA binding domain-containing protein [Chloroflexota bacterium]